MKTIIFKSLLFVGFLTLSLGCKKDGAKSNKEGQIKVTVQYESPSGSASVWSWASTKVELSKDWEIIATMYASPDNPNVDFGKYEYGENYTVVSNTKVTRVNPSSGQTFQNNAWSDPVTFEVKKATTSVTTYVKVH